MVQIGPKGGTICSGRQFYTYILWLQVKNLVQGHCTHFDYDHSLCEVIARLIKINAPKVIIIFFFTDICFELHGPSNFV